MKEYLSIKEAIKEFGISRNSIYNLIKAGTIKKYQLGEIARRTFVLKSEIIDAFKVKDEIAIKTDFIQMGIDKEKKRRKMK